MEYISISAEETYQIASRFAKQLNKGDIITLDGDLGAGKTAFVRGLAEGLGVTDMVVSPTFTIVNEYRHGEIPIFHFDVYRLECDDDLYDIGWEDYTSGDGICVVEWSTIMPEVFFMPHYSINITKDITLSEDYRKITIDFIGGKK